MNNTTITMIDSIAKRSTTAELIKLPQFWITVAILISVTLLVATAMTYDYYFKNQRRLNNRNDPLNDPERFIQMNRIGRVNSHGMVEYEEIDTWAFWASGSEGNQSRTSVVSNAVTQANADGQTTTVAAAGETAGTPVETVNNSIVSDRNNNNSNNNNNNNNKKAAVTAVAEATIITTTTTTMGTSAQGNSTTTTAKAPKADSREQTSVQSEGIIPDPEEVPESSPKKSST